MQSPDEPPTRPNSVVSTEFANQLRSRPPTFFNEPLASPAPAQPPTSIPPSDLSTFVTQVIPVVGVGAAAAPPQPEPIAGPLVKKDSGSSSKSSSRESRMSWRKAPPPFPTMLLTGTEGVEDDQGESAHTEQLAHVRPHPHSHGVINDHDRVGRGLASGLQTGREYALRAPTVSTPSSGEVSALLKSDFGHTPPLPRDEDITSHSFPTGPRLSMDSSVAPTELFLANNPHTELVPLTVSPPSDEALRHRS